MFSFDFDYDLINILFLLLMCFVGKQVSKGRPYWKYTVWVIIAFTLVEGLRYGRGVDYLHYIDVYLYDMEDSQVLFTWINRFLKALGVSAISAFSIYAIPFIIGGTTLLKKMRRYGAYMFPLFLLSFIVFHEAFIRQALSTSFYFLFISKLFDILERRKKWRKHIKDYLALVIFAVFAISIHSIQVVAILVSSAIILFLHKPVNWMYSIPLLLVGKVIIANYFDWSYLNGLLNLLSGSEKLAGYTDNADLWFSEEAMNEAYDRNISIQFLEAFAYSALLYLGYKVCRYVQFDSTLHKFRARENHVQMYISFYNMFVLGVLIYQTFYNLEIVRRVAYCWYLFWFVPLSLVLYYWRKPKLFNVAERCLLIGFVFWIWEYIRFLFVFSEKPLFIWDL